MYMVDYIAFFCAIKHSSETETFLIESLKSYDIGSYLIVRETSETSHKLTNGEHYHFLVQMKNDDYVRYRKRVFLDHFKLKGRATKECGRQYGKVNYLKDPDRMSVYMMKDNSVVDTTFTESQLQSWYDQSFKKSEQKGYKEMLRAYVDDNQDILIKLLEGPLGDVHRVFTKICELQITFNRMIAVSKEMDTVGGMTNSLTKAQISNFSIWYIMYHFRENGKSFVSDADLTYYILYGDR